MAEKDRNSDNRYFFSFLSIFILLITVIYCITAVYGTEGIPPMSSIMSADSDVNLPKAADTDHPAANTSDGSAAEAAEVRPVIVFPLDGNITSVFALRIDPFYNPLSGGEPTYEFHRGIDISAAKSRDIHACADGVVIFTGYDSGYGNYLMIEHDGFVSLYAHCSQLLLSEGNIVTAGDSIAIAGSTGRSTGNHLHFEIRVDGEYVDPLEFVGCVFTGVIY